MNRVLICEAEMRTSMRLNSSGISLQIRRIDVMRIPEAE